jgi:ribosomal protein S18 acetylase RimI-like enzyme
MAPPNDLIAYSPMSLAHHNCQDVAGLIYESAPDLFTLMFGSRAIPCLTELVQRSQNRFSHQYVRIAALNDQVVGIAVLVPAAQLNHNDDYLDVLNPSQRLWLNLLQRLILNRVLQHDFPTGAFYIGNLAVAIECRNQGIGRQLLLNCLAEVGNASNATTPIFISVDVNNGRAQKLYESLGFQIATTKAIGFWGMRVGSHLLSLVTSPPPPQND